MVREIVQVSTSHVFAPYQVPALDEMAKELDAILARIVSAATG